ncbi:hypothetical protein C2857_004429 [Epichloe festucae Fl1]|uniref:DUF7029 domain-containing protein n=1 Tax=Epichloe festucae (strain Fl1) TaxID=877507 RepID=A0A7S9KP55_EPIFF|nr:hypothetical protein C2857_004429 [Epichloe festucae Fl1]
MLSAAYAVALLLGVAPSTHAAQPRPRYPFTNGTTSGSAEAQVEMKAETKSAGPGCAASYPSSKPSPTQSPTSSTFVNTAPTTTLSPNVHWSCDTKAVENIIPIQPGKGSELYYGVSGKAYLLTALHFSVEYIRLTAQDPSESGHFAFLTYHFTLPSVNVDHTDHVTVQYRDNEGITASFTNQGAFNHARRSWSTRDGLILIAHVAGCGDYAKGERCYFNVTDLEFKDQELSIVARGDSKHPDEIVTTGETEWGWWDARKEKLAPVVSATASGNVSTWVSAIASGNASTWGSRLPTSSQVAAPMGETEGDANLGRSTTGQLGCVAPPDIRNGLPTACVGPGFDQILDEKLGHGKLSIESERFLEGLLKSRDSTGWNPTSSALSPIAEKMGRRSLMQRDIWSRIRNFFRAPIEAFYSSIASATSLEGGFDRDLSFQYPDPKSPNKAARTLTGTAVQTQSPWGAAILLKTFGSNATRTAPIHMSVYCVGCGVSGEAKVAGRAKWSLLKGLEEGHIELNTNLKFVLKIGIDGRAERREDFYTHLNTYGLPSLSYGIVTVGPFVTVGVRVGVSTSVRGNFLAGAEMGMQDSLVVMDLVDSSQNKQTGWTPYFKPIFEAAGEIDVSAELGIPIGLKCGFRVSRWEKAVGVVEEPSIRGVARATGSAGLNSSDGGFGRGCHGIMTEISWRNKIWVLKNAKGAPSYDTNDRAFVRKCISETVSSDDGGETIDARNSSTRARPASHFHQSLEAPSRVNEPSQLTYSMATVPTELYDSAANTRLSRLVNPLGSTKVISCANGNLYAVRNDSSEGEYCFGLWETTQRSEVVHDGVHRPMHYYSNTMSVLGVSRLRATDAGAVPRTSVAVAFFPLRRPGSQDLYVAVDASQEVYFPVACDFVDGSASKVFLARDPVRGIETLQRKDAMHAVTGGEVAKCQLLAIKT